MAFIRIAGICTAATMRAHVAGQKSPIATAGTTVVWLRMHEHIRLAPDGRSGHPSPRFVGPLLVAGPGPNTPRIPASPEMWHALLRRVGTKCPAFGVVKHWLRLRCAIAS